MKRSFAGNLLGLSILLGVQQGAAALPLKTVTLDPPGLTPSGTVLFTLTHRFSHVGAKVSNSPTFCLSGVVAPRLEAAVRYATNSLVNGNFNEWEPRLQYQLLGDESGARLAVIAAYNTAAISGDGALAGALDLGPVTLQGEGRAFSSGYGIGGPTAAVGVGAVWHLTRFLGLTADVAKIVVTQNAAAIAAQAGEGSLMPAWSLGTQFVIPYSPHALAVYMTNSNTQTLQGASLGSSVRVGFDFTVPFSDPGRWAAIFQPPPESNVMQPNAETTAAQPANQRDVAIQNLQFKPGILTVAPGTTVRWVNRDNVPHTVTSATGAWDSGILAPGASYTRRFDQKGDFKYLCSLHPFMKGEVHVR